MKQPLAAVATPRANPAHPNEGGARVLLVTNYSTDRHLRPQTAHPQQPVEVDPADSSATFFRRFTLCHVPGRGWAHAVLRRVGLAWLC